MTTKRRAILLRPPTNITNTILWLSVEKGRTANEIASDLLLVGIKRLGIELRTEPPPKPAKAKESTDEDANPLSQVAGP